MTSAKPGECSSSLRIDKKFEPVRRGFIYMLFMHSESLLIQEVAEDIFRQRGVQSSLEYEIKHRAIIE